MASIRSTTFLSQADPYIVDGIAAYLGRPWPHVARRGSDPVQEHFSSHTLAETLRDLYLAERTGVLRLRRGDVKKEISFQRGMIVLAASNADDEDLGRSLMREGKIRSEERRVGKECRL